MRGRDSDMNARAGTAARAIALEAEGRARVMIVIGTRPEAVKLAPIARVLAGDALLRPVVVSTGQHRELLDQAFGCLGVEPDLDLALMQDRQDLAELTGRVLAGVTTAIRQFEPDALVVQGDTTTAMGAALAGFYERVPVVHVEAGLRSGDLGDPFPEEANRRLVSALAALHLAPTAGARDNLVREGHAIERVLVTGNTVVDALLLSVGGAAGWVEPALERLDHDPRRVVLLTAHRRESWGAPLRSVGKAIAEVAEAEPGVLVVLPAHPNPAVRASLLEPLGGLGNVLVTGPLCYADMCRLLQRCHLVVTDSGGLQEEAPTLAKPVVVLRDVTERPEGVQAGAARLVGTELGPVRDTVLWLLRDDAAHAAMAAVANPYGDGRAAARSAGAIAHLLGLAARPAPFEPMTASTRPPAPAPQPTGGLSR